METNERLLQLAEDELAQYSSRLRKFEKLRPKIAALLSASQRSELKQSLQADLAAGGLAALVEKQRQAVALPFWGITGLSLLAGFLNYRWAWVVAATAVALAFTLQRWGWKLQAKRLLLEGIEDFEKRRA